MAEIRYPLGAPTFLKPFPGPDGTLDTEIAQQESAVRRRRSPFEPPEEIGIVPQIVPRNLFRAAQAEDVRTRGAAMSVRHDAADMAFNTDADSIREGLTGFRTAGDLLTPQSRIEMMSRPNALLTQSLATTAIGQMRRTNTSTQLWRPGPVPDSDEVEPYFNHLSTVTQRAAWGYRGAPSGGDGSTPIVVEPGWLGKLKGVAGKVQDVGERILGLPGAVADVIPIREVGDIAAAVTNPINAVADQILHRGEGAGQLQRAASAIGSSWDGKEFWRSVWVNGGAGIASGFGTVGDFERYRFEAERSFDEHWASLPRPVQLFAEELNPANVALAWAGGPLSNVLKSSGTRAGRLLGSLVAPLASNPIKATSLQVASGVASRLAYESTEDWTWAQFGIPGTGGLTETGENIKVSPLRLGAGLGAGGLLLGAEQVLERGIARMTARGAQGGFTAELRSIVPDLPDNWTVAKPEAYEQLHRTPTVRNNQQAFDQASTGSPLRVTGFREDSGPRLPGTGVFYAADPTTAAQYRKGGPGDLLAEPLEFHNPLVTDSKQELLEAFSRNADEEVASRAQTLLAAQSGEGVPHAEIDTFIAEQAQAQGRDAVVYRAPTDTGGAYPFNASEVVDIRRDPMVVLRELDGVREEVESLQSAIAFQTRALNDEAFAAANDATHVTPSGLAETRMELREMLREESRLTTEARDVPAVGFPRTNELPPVYRAALGDGGAMKAGTADEMLAITNGEVMSEWRQGSTQLSGSILPFRATLRGGRPAGSKAMQVPDIIPVSRPATVRDVTHQPTLTAGESLADTLFTASERAGDLAAQGAGQTVPAGHMHNISRAEARLPAMGVASRVINWFNQASTDPVQRVAAIAQTMTRGELATRLAPSRAQFTGRVREMFGGTDRLPEHFEYIGDADRMLHGVMVPAEGHPLTGTIVDFIENPAYYNQPASQYLPEFMAYRDRNAAVGRMLRDEFGMDDAAPGSVNLGEERLSQHFFESFDGPAASRPMRVVDKERLTLTEQLADPKEALNDPVTDLAEIFTRIDQDRIGRAEAETFRWAIGGSRKPRTGWGEVPALEALSGEKVWLPPEQAASAQKWLESQEFGLANWFESLKNVRLGGDFSPLTIQGIMGWSLHPVSVARDVVEGMKRGMLEGNPLRPFTNEAMFEDIAAAPERWMRFYTYFGSSPAGGTPREWRSGFLETAPQWLGEKLSALNVPGSEIAGRIAAAPGQFFKQTNDSMTNALVRGMESTFNDYGTMLIQHGTPEDEAWAAAARVAKRGWLQQDFDVLGVSAGRRSLERGALTSTTFVRQPVAFMTEAVTGYGKLIASPLRLAGTAGQWTQLTASESLAVQAFTRMSGTFTGIAAISAALTAEERGWTPEEALERGILDIGGPDWMTLWLSKDLKIPLGGPYRGLMRAVAPQEFLGQEHVPFGGMLNFFSNRIIPPVDLGLDLIKNEDFYHNKIVTEDGLKGLAQGLAYAANNMVPVFAGVPYSNMRAGQSVSEGVREAAFQYFGQNPLQASQYEALERERRLGGREIFNLGYEGRVALGMTPEQAAVHAPTLAQLRTAIGTRAANAAVELANPNVAGARDAYVKDLRRRAAVGDHDAEALLVSIDTQVELAALASTKVVAGALDKLAYRNGRGPIIDRNVGRSGAYQDVFDKMRRSDSPIDRDSAQYQDLYDKATTQVEIDGRMIAVGVDYEALEEMQQALLGSLGEPQATLVEQNVDVAPLGSGPAEVELRKHRHDLRVTGFWRIEDEMWAKGKPDLLKSNVVPPSAMGAVAAASSFSEYRAVVVEGITGELVKQGFQPETAVQRAKSLFDARDEVQQWNSAKVAKKAQWAQANAESGLAEQAIQWGYLSDSQTNLDAIGGGRGTKPAPAPLPSVPAAAAIGTNAQLRVEHLQGASYGQLAIKYGITRDAVMGRVRRAGEA